MLNNINICITLFQHLQQKYNFKKQKYVPYCLINIIYACINVQGLQQVNNLIKKEFQKSFKFNFCEFLGDLLFKIIQKG